MPLPLAGPGAHLPALPLGCRGYSALLEGRGHFGTLPGVLGLKDKESKLQGTLWEPRDGLRDWVWLQGLPGTQASSVYYPASCLSPPPSLKPGPCAPDLHLSLLSCGIVCASLVRPSFPCKSPVSDLASSGKPPPREGTGDRHVLPVVILTHSDLMLHLGKGLEITASPQMAQVCRLEFTVEHFPNTNAGPHVVPPITECTKRIMPAERPAWVTSCNPHKSPGVEILLFPLFYR